MKEREGERERLREIERARERERDRQTDRKTETESRIYVLQNQTHLVICYMSNFVSSLELRL